jgi:hypothetical protein
MSLPPKPVMEPWRRRMLVGVTIVGGLVSLVVVAAITWAVMFIHEDKSGMRHVPAKIVSVNSSKRSSFGRGIKFGRYNLTVRYRSEEGVEETTNIDVNTYGFPWAGQSITLLFTKYGTVESDPFPELWIILVCVYAGFGGLVWLFVKGYRTLFGDEGGPGKFRDNLIIPGR